MSTSEYPVGLCTGRCTYAEPHRHGFDCLPFCECEGIGPITEPLGEEDLQECDWGFCNRPAAARRLDDGTVDALGDAEVWLSVCRWHAGWLDHEPSDLESGA